MLQSLFKKGHYVKKSTFLLPVLLAFEVLAQTNQAVKETNFNVALSHSEINDDSMSNWRSTSLSSGVNFPLYNYLGANIFISGSKSGELKYNYYNDSYTTQSDDYGSGAMLFLRNADIGKIGVTGGYSKTKTTTDIYNGMTTHTLKNTTTSRNYSLYGSYYHDDFTLSASRRYLDLDNGHILHYVDAGIGYYLNENTAFDATVSGMDSSNKFRLHLAHQPSLLNNSTIVGISYEKNDYDNSFTFFLSYHFQTKVSLRTRDREYR